MATQYVFAVGKMIASQPATVTVDRRLLMLARSRSVVDDEVSASQASKLAELLDWRRETGQELPLPADLILWLEDRGYVTDLETGCTSRLEPLQNMIDEAAELEEDELWQLEDKLENPASYPDYPLDHNDSDPIQDAYLAGTGDQAAGCYNPPRGCIEAHDAYIRGHNDAWAKAQKVTWWRRK